MNTVSKLIECREKSREEMTEIKRLGRPIPDLNIVQHCYCNKKTIKRKFSRFIYTKYLWLCGCDDRSAMFCFPCLLFGDRASNNVWITTGIIDLVHISDKAEKHAISLRHLIAMLNFADYFCEGSPILGTIESQMNYHAHNAEVKKNVCLLNRVMDCIRFCIPFNIPILGENKQKGLLEEMILFNLTDFTELRLQFMSSEIFNEIADDLIFDILDCMLEACREIITCEMKTAKYLSIIIGDIPDICENPQAALVYRYLCRGSLVERFWGFLDATNDDFVNLSKRILNEIAPHLANDPNKLVSQSYSPKLAAIYHETVLEDLVIAKYPFADVVLSSKNNLNQLFLEAVSKNQDIRLFFVNLNYISAFFKNCKGNNNPVCHIIEDNFPNPLKFPWNRKILRLKIVHEQRHLLMKCCGRILNSVTMTSTIREVNFILHILKDPLFIFWLKNFYGILPDILNLIKNVQSQVTDAQKLKDCIRMFKSNVCRNINDTATITIELNGEPLVKRIKRDEDNVDETKEICRLVSSYFKPHFKCDKHLQAKSLFLVSRFKDYLTVFPRPILKIVTEAYPMLDAEKLHRQLEVLYKSTEFETSDGLVEILQFIMSGKLTEIFSEMYNLLQILVTIPMVTEGNKQSLSTMADIKTAVGTSSMPYNCAAACVMITVEEKIISSTPDFNDRAVRIFAHRDKWKSKFLEMPH